MGEETTYRRAKTNVLNDILPLLHFLCSFLTLIKDECPHNSAREKDGRNSFLNGRWDGERKASLNPNIESMKRYYSYISSESYLFHIMDNNFIRRVIFTFYKF